MFYDAHRPDTDCYVGIHLLAQQMFSHDCTGMAFVLDAARKKYLRIYATGSPFSEKEKLKARGYKWNPGDNGRPKAWYIDVPTDAAKSELDFLVDTGCRTTEEFVFDARDRFSARIGK